MTDIAAKCDRNVSGGPLLQSELRGRHREAVIVENLYGR